MSAKALVVVLIVCMPAIDEQINHGCQPLRETFTVIGQNCCDGDPWVLQRGRRNTSLIRGVRCGAWEFRTVDFGGDRPGVGPAEGEADGAGAGVVHKHGPGVPESVRVRLMSSGDPRGSSSKIRIRTIAGWQVPQRFDHSRRMRATNCRGCIGPTAPA